jgi:hypothetical protein
MLTGVRWYAMSLTETITEDDLECMMCGIKYGHNDLEGLDYGCCYICSYSTEDVMCLVHLTSCEGCGNMGCSGCGSVNTCGICNKTYCWGCMDSAREEDGGSCDMCGSCYYCEDCLKNGLCDECLSVGNSSDYLLDGDGKYVLDFR